MSDKERIELCDEDDDEKKGKIDRLRERLPLISALPTGLDNPYNEWQIFCLTQWQHKEPKFSIVLHESSLSKLEHRFPARYIFELDSRISKSQLCQPICSKHLIERKSGIKWKRRGYGLTEVLGFQQKENGFYVSFSFTFNASTTITNVGICMEAFVA